MSEHSNLETKDDLLQIVLDSLTYPFYVIEVADHSIRLANRAARELHGTGESTCYALTHRQDQPCHTEEHSCPLEIIKETGKPTVVEHVHYDAQGNPMHVEVHGFPIFDQAGNLVQIIEYCVDITERKHAEEDLRRIEWMLRERPQGESLVTYHAQRYGDLSDINTSRLIRDSVGEPILRGIVDDYLSLLETASAIYEKNGDYAYGVFTSGWCRFLDLASRAQCGTTDNREAMNCGLWQCHESCWTKASRESIERGEPVDVECSGGIRMYAVPIRAGEEIVGSINIGYGDPPRDPERLKELADRFAVDVDELRQRAEAYQSRPPFIINLAKQRLMRSARLIGEIVQRRRAEEALATSQRFLQRITRATPDIIYTYDVIEHRNTYRNRDLAEVLGYSPEQLEAMGDELLRELVHPDDLPRIMEQFRQIESVTNGNILEVDYRMRHADGSYRWFRSRDVVFSRTPDGRVHELLGIAQDITERKQAEENLSRYEMLSAHSRDVILFMQRDTGRILEANTAATRAYGYSREELLARTVYDLRAPSTLNLTVEQIAQADTYGILFETVHQRKDGSTFPVEVNSQGATVGGERTLISVIRDISERKRTEQALRESEQRFRTLAESTFEGICISENAHIRDCNDQFAHMLGYERREMLGRWVGDILAPNVREEILDNIRQGRELVIEHEMLHKDGSLRIVEAHGRTVVDEDRPTRITVIRDITERKRAEQALRESEQRFKSTFDNAAVGMAHVALDGRFIRFNNRFCEITGHPGDDLPRWTCSQITRREDWLTEQGHIQQLLDGKIDHYSMEKRYIRSDGRLTWASQTRSLQRNDAGEPEYFIVVAQDISQRKGLEADLRKLNEQLEEQVIVRTEQLATTVDQLQGEMVRRALLEGKLRERSKILEAFFQHTITPLAFMDRDLRFVRVNEAFARADGKAPEDLVGKSHFDLYPNDENRAVFEHVVRTGQAYRAYAKPFNYRNDPQQGTAYWNWQITPLLDEQGRVEFLVFNLEDVTEQQRALEEVQRRAGQLQQLTLELSEAEDRERKRLAEVLHDDLQQTLAAAKFHVGLLDNRTRHGEDVHDMIGQVKDMLAQAIDKSRSLSHELSPPVLGQSDLCETFEWLAEHIRAKHGLTVHVEYCEPVEVHSRPLKAFLFKAAQELLFNVIKHAHVGEAQLRLRYRRGCIYLSVADRGQGFDPQSLGRSGFGLMSIRERVKLLGGDMRIRSIPGKGSVFLIKVSSPTVEATVETPWAGEPSAAKTAAQRKRVEREGDAGLRILLVDDHKIVREGLEAMLMEEKNINVVGQAGNGREAIELAHKLRPDVIVMDVSMPVMTGDEATRQIKRDLPHIRVIALSMFDDARTADRMRKAGANAYLLKTAPSEQLLAAIRGSENPSLVES